MNIRIANSDDQGGIRNVHLAAFDEAENEVIANLAAELLTDTSSPAIINLVAEFDEDLVGHVAFSPVWLQANKKLAGYILAPLAVTPEAQQKGIGAQLVEHGIQRLKQQGASMIFVYGDPQYYSRFGFSPQATKNFPAPYPLQYPDGWQALELRSKTTPSSSGTIECVKALSQPALW